MAGPGRGGLCAAVAVLMLIPANTAFAARARPHLKISGWSTTGNVRRGPAITGAFYCFRRPPHTLFVHLDFSGMPAGLPIVRRWFVGKQPLLATREKWAAGLRSGRVVFGVRAPAGLLPARYRFQLTTGSRVLVAGSLRVRVGSCR
jgi:hypothetical protein